MEEEDCRPPSGCSREEILNSVQQNGYSLRWAPEELRNDKEVVLAAVTQAGGALEYVSEALRGDREVVLAAVAQDGYSLIDASRELRCDREIVVTAVKQTGNALRYASERLRGDVAVVEEALNQSSLALAYTTWEIRRNRQLALVALRHNEHAVRFIDDILFEDRGFVLDAYKQGSYIALWRCSENLRADANVAHAAVARDGLAIQHVSESLKNEPEICLAAIESGGIGILQYCSEPLRCGGLLEYANNLVHVRNAFTHTFYSTTMCHKYGEVTQSVPGDAAAVALVAAARGEEDVCCLSDVNSSGNSLRRSSAKRQLEKCISANPEPPPQRQCVEEVLKPGEHSCTSSNSSIGTGSVNSSCNASSSDGVNGSMTAPCVTDMLYREGPKVATRLKHLIADFAGVRHGKRMESLLATVEILKAAIIPLPESL